MYPERYEKKWHWRGGNTETQKFVDELLPSSIRSRLQWFDSTFPDAVWKRRRDWAHGSIHTREILTNINYLQKSGFISQDDAKLAMSLNYYHDKGYLYVDYGLLKQDEHQLGSIWFARQQANDPRIVYGILHHVDDCLPEGAPKWVKVMQGLDRLAAVGFTGANRMLLYNGIRETMLPSEEEIEDARIFGEIVYPCEWHYEDPARRYFYKQLPDLNNANRYTLQETMNRNLTWIVGDAESGIDPIDDVLQDVFAVKIRNTHAVLEDLI